MTALSLHTLGDPIHAALMQNKTLSLLIRGELESDLSPKHLQKKCSSLAAKRRTRS